MPNAFLKLRPAKTEEITPSAQIGFLSSFLNIGKRSMWEQLAWKPGKKLSLEIASIDQKTRFYMVPPDDLQGYFVSQVLSQYPKTLIDEEKIDPLETVLQNPDKALVVLKQAYSYVFPVKTFAQPNEIPPLSAVLGFFAKINEGENAYMQMVLEIPNQSSIQGKIRANLTVKDAEGNETNNPYHAIIQKKLSSPMILAQIRLLFTSQQSASVVDRVAELAGSYGVYTMAEANSIVYSRPSGWQLKGIMNKMKERSFYYFQPTLVLNLEEAASLWHLPDTTLANIKSINWGKTLLSEAPDNLPVAELLKTDEEKREINFFGKTEWRNHDAIFGIKREDRRKHVYIIGKTGAGKSTLIANMAINDIRNGEGVAVIDPHGDLCEMILDYIPKRRVNDVIYLDPTLHEDRNFSLNLFDSEGAAHTDVVASGIISVFYKLYYNSWGPRLEYILRNSILTLLYHGEATFADIIKLLTNKRYRNEVVDRIVDRDPVLKEFWLGEFEMMNDRLRTEAISPILNKVGQFLSSQRIRQIVGSRHSTFSLADVMNQKKILLLNLSQGKLGEDTTALLGAMFITKMQLTAMARVNMPQDQRPDFYLYVDEFQNFATHSFIKILSEARKYRLNLILANQYIGQVDEEIQKAVFGNVGTLMTFVIGAADAALFEKEFGGKFTADDLVALGKYETLMKMTIDGLTTEPFVSKTLPLPSVINENKEKILRMGMERYYKKVMPNS